MEDEQPEGGRRDGVMKAADGERGEDGGGERELLGIHLSHWINKGLVLESSQQLVSPILKKCWTEWFDRDDPTGTGDWETLFHLHQNNPGKICPTPLQIEATTLSGVSAAATGDVFYKSDTITGFVCRTQDQTPVKMCNDYRVRFLCPPTFCQKVCWTKWYDRDNPSGTGDWELLSILKAENPGEICDTPLHMEVVTTDTLTPASSTGQNFLINSPTQGFVCRNMDQKYSGCRDYKVRFGCPC